MSVDPFVHGHGNSQGINPYSYILNNPLSGTDPTGYEPKDETDKQPSKLDKLRENSHSAESNINSGSGAIHSASNNGAESNSAAGSSSFGSTTEIMSQAHISVAKPAEEGVPNVEQEFNDMAWSREGEDDVGFMGDISSHLSGLSPQGFKTIMRESISLGLNSIGAVVGAALLLLPEPTTATKWLGGALLTKSSVGIGLNVANVRKAWQGRQDFNPSSLANLITQDMGSTAQGIGNIVDLSIDFASGRAAANAVIRYVPKSGKYGTSEYLDEAFTVQQAMGSKIEKTATFLTIGHTGLTLNDLKNSQ